MHRADKLEDLQNVSIFLYFAGKHIVLSFFIEPSYWSFSMRESKN